MKNQRLFGYLFLLSGFYLFFNSAGFFYLDNNFVPSLILLIVGYFSSVKFFNEGRTFLFVSSAALFFASITFVIESTYKLRHLVKFEVFAFFFSVALIFLLLYAQKRKHPFFVIFSVLFFAVGYFFVEFFPSQLLRTLLVSIGNVLIFAPFVYIFIGINLLKRPE